MLYNYLKWKTSDLIIAPINCRAYRFTNHFPYHCEGNSASIIPILTCEEIEAEGSKVLSSS